MKRFVIGSLMGMILLIASACIIGTPTPSVQPPADQPAGPQTGETHALQVVNDSSIAVCFMYISPSSSQDWGEDWLGSDTIQPGDEFDFTVEAGTYDLEARDCDQNVLSTQPGVEVTQDTTWTLSDLGPSDDTAGQYRLAVVNESSFVICAVYISPTTSDSWGENWLGSNSIQAGMTITFDVAAGTYDLKADDCEGQELLTQAAVEVTQDITWTISDN
jgi:hypothetical protein